MLVFLTLLLFVIGTLVFFLPTIIAYDKQCVVLPVFLINLIAGWTLVGWLVALVWAITDDTRR